MSVLQKTSGRVLAVVAAAAIAAGSLFLATPAFADTAPPDPSNPATPTTVSDDVLPTPQIDGVVWAQAVVGNVDYAVGSFTTARPYGSAPGQNTVTRNNILAYNLTTGALITSFAPSLNAQALAIAASPDGTRIYVGGDFTSVDGNAYYRIAAFSTATGQIIPSFRPIMGASVRSLAATNSTVYAGGWFKSANGLTRDYLAALAADNGATLPFTANADYNVNALAVTADGSRLIVGGQFANLSGNSAKGLGAVDPTTGAYIPWAANQKVQDYGINASITSLWATSTSVYGSGYVWTQGTGNLEGVFQANPTTGVITGLEDCHGDTYSVFATSSVMYEVGHQHYCGNVGGFPQTTPWTFHHLNAFSTVSTTLVKSNTEGSYYNWGGYPALSPQDYYPDFVNGTYTGQDQATWSVAGNADYVVAGGEFPTVNGIAQQGLTRFAMPSIAPNKVGPQGIPLVPVATASTGRITVSFNATYDNDNGYLTYNILRDGTGNPVFTTTVHSNFFTTPAITFVDTGVTPGSSHFYKVIVTDPFGNSTNRSTATVKVPGTAPSVPTASFTTSATGLTVAVNGSGSTDTGGTISSYAWTFGDGGTGSGVTATHTYSAAGTYTIGLTVTDSNGVTASKSASVTVTATAPLTSASDSFNRTVTAGWGSADTGGPWTVSGTSTNYSVAPGYGQQSGAAGATLTSTLPGVSSSDTDALVTVADPAMPTGGGQYISDIARLVGSADYEGRLWISSAGTVQLQLQQSSTSLGTYTVPGLTYTPGMQLSIRVQVFGTSPTTVRARVWPAGTTEPTTWQLSATDSTAGLQVAGSPALRSYISGSATGTTLTRFSAFAVKPAQ